MIEVLKKDKDVWNQYCLSEEQTANAFRDAHDRFLFSYSGVKDPTLAKGSHFLTKNGYHAKYPQNHQFAICLTHDIDALRTSRQVSVRRMISHLIRKRFGQSLQQLKSVLRPFDSDLWNYTLTMLELEKRYKATASYYFLSLEQGDQDFNFEVRDVKMLLKKITESGSEVGLHGGHDAYMNLQKLKVEKKRLEEALGRSVIGYRNHYLKFVAPVTWYNLEKSGFKYDTTVGYADMIGFRNGLCHPYRPYNLEQNCQLNILEIPLAFMDVTASRYMKMNREETWSKMKAMIDHVAELRGVFTLLWHNKEDHSDLELYEKVLSYGRENNAWMASGEDIYKWWESQQKLQN